MTIYDFVNDCFNSFLYWLGVYPRCFLNTVV